MVSFERFIIQVVSYPSFRCCGILCSDEWSKNGGNIMSKATLRIGVSGHQQIGDEETIEFVSQQLRELLATFQCQTQERGQNMPASSALALGTDQLFVKIALEMRIPVELVIPCSHYEEIFSTTEARDEYHRLLSRC
jgi:hypothetical protein